MNLKLVNFLFSSLLILPPREINGAKILAVEFVGSKSHVFTYLSLLEELVARGHNVTLLSPAKGFAKPNTVKEIRSADFQDMMSQLDGTSGATFMSMYEQKEKNINTNPWVLLTEVLPKYCSQLYDREDVKELLEQDFDLLFTQPLFNECSYGFLHRIMEKNKAPLVLFVPTSAPNFVVDKTGGYHPPSFVSNIFLGLRQDMSFYERMLNIGTNTISEFISQLQYLPAMEAIYKSKLGEDIPSAGKIIGEASLILSNSHFSLSGLKPNLPNVVDVGGIHSRPAKPLPKDLEEFVAGSGSHGFILFSFGTGLRSADMPKGKRTMFLKAFSKLKQRVVWKYEDDDEELEKILPKNVLLVKWMPQQDLLGHPKIHLFISHCGLGGTEEAIYHGVPILGIPFFGDQPMNAREGENHGYLLKLEWNDITEDILLQGINELIVNPKYRDNMKRLANVFKDQIDDPLQRGVWWVEYVLRHKGAPQLQSVARNLNYIEYHSLDVISVYLFILILLFSVPYYLLKFSYNKYLNSKNRLREGKTGEKKQIEMNNN